MPSMSRSKCCMRSAIRLTNCSKSSRRPGMPLISSRTSLSIIGATGSGMMIPSKDQHAYSRPRSKRSSTLPCTSSSLSARAYSTSSPPSPWLASRGCAASTGFGPRGATQPSRPSVPRGWLPASLRCSTSSSAFYAFSRLTPVTASAASSCTPARTFWRYSMAHRCAADGCLMAHSSPCDGGVPSTSTIWILPRSAHSSMCKPGRA
mmetsp:Transcript_21967/g.50511  ORF Transcript_21967/g.50511 Transcript_21967/m.50511 type:complete len:206 (-) Transcript_21967:1395-2012(-)